MCLISVTRGEDIGKHPSLIPAVLGSNLGAGMNKKTCPHTGLSQISIDLKEIHQLVIDESNSVTVLFECVV